MNSDNERLKPSLSLRQRLPHFDDTSSFMAKSSARELVAYGAFPPELALSLCAFVDILGFSNIVKDAHSRNCSKRIMHLLTSALSLSTAAIDKSKNENNLWCHKFFTDNLLIGLKIQSNLEYCAANMIHIVATHQLAMALSGFAVRGAITAGMLHLSNDLVFGEALVRAHDLEANPSLPRQPRVILDEETKEIVLGDTSFSGMCFKDTDGQLFVNYLDWYWFDAYVPELGAQVLARHKKFIEKNLNAFSTNRKLYRKYLWLAQYHNFFCLNTPDHFNAGYLSDLDKLLIADVEEGLFEYV
ncbi:MAG: hypothetical protein K2Y39_29005 [Candidatus Obscuribacterales bacterium]|nr:hypothetical protein [Candidatus Obscuribacterales bacterium]